MKKPDPKEIAASLGGDEGAEPMPEDGADEQTPDSDLESAAADLCDAVESKDYKGVAEALKHAFTLLESEPHEEAGESAVPEKY